VWQFRDVDRNWIAGMAVEIERKFLVTGDGWKAQVTRRRHLRQAYLSRQGKTSIRVRITDASSATLTIKSRGGRTCRAEFEYPLPVADALTLLELRDGLLLSKVRHEVRGNDGLTWEIDVFEGENTGLVIAEVELAHERQPVVLPPWIGREVTHEERYYNSRLAHHPYRMFAHDAPSLPA
jgi:adenylate cyclase